MARNNQASAAWLDCQPTHSHREARERHRPSGLVRTGGRLLLLDGQVHMHAIPKGNYVSGVGNYKIADTTAWAMKST